jgi:MFS transporter, DHA3 family, macrolide efflux protein
LGMIDSGFGIGIILGGLLLSAWGGFKKRILTCLLGIIGMGFGILVFGMLPAGWFYAGLGGVFLAGFMNVMANGPLEAILQSTVSPDMQGRVFSLLGALASSMAPLSLLVAGPVSDSLGVRTWYVLGGGGCILMALVAIFIPAIMQIEENRIKVQVEAQPG